MRYWNGYLLVLFVVGGGLITLFIYVYRNKKSKSLLMSLTLIFLSVFVAIMALEFYFKVFFAEPDVINTLARRNWYARYLHSGTKNSLGFRGREWTDELVAEKTKVMVVGDSFVEGLGIENPDDRFSGLLAQKLGSDYVVFNLGDSGSNTGNQIEALLQYPYSPDILIWSYFINDVEGTAGLKWLEMPPLDQLPPSWSPFEKSHALNFLYW